jgi:hypothetical protein
MVYWFSTDVMFLVMFGILKHVDKNDMLCELGKKVLNHRT